MFESLFKNKIKQEGEQKMNMRRLLNGDRLELLNGEEVTIKSIWRDPRGKFCIEYEEYSSITFKYNEYGNILGKLNHYSIREKVEPVVKPEEALIAIKVPLYRAENHIYMRLLTESFGIKRNEIPRPTYENHGERCTLICRPDQFAHFILRRNELRLQNMVKELEAEYVSVVTKNMTIIYVAENK